MTFLDDLRRQFEQYRPTTPQGWLDAASLVTAPVPVLGDVAGLLADGYSLATDPESRTPLTVGLMMAGALPFVPNSRLTRMAGGKIGGLLDGSNASRSPRIYDPKPLPQRPFDHDYPDAGAARPDGGGRVTIDIDGRPVAPGAYIAGRRVAGGGDASLQERDIGELGARLGATIAPSARGRGTPLGEDFGRYIPGHDEVGNLRADIYFDKAQPPDVQARLQAHEVSHLLDDRTVGDILKNGSRIPIDGIKRDLGLLYEELNTGTWHKPGRGAKPKTFGYGPDKEGAELMAEAIRAYLTDPNFIKSKYPAVAQRIRDHINTHPKLNNVVHFNSFAPATLLGGGLLMGEDEQ